MKRISKVIILLSFLAPVICAAQEPDPFADTSVEYVSVENQVNDDDRLIWDVPELDKAIIHTAPADRADGLVVGEIGVDGGNKEMIVSLAKEIAAKEHGNFDSLLIAHQGKLIFESYYLLGRVNLTHPQASATKAYTALALGRAIQLGYLTMTDLGKPVVSFLENLDPEKFVAGVEKITLHKALTMRGGLNISDAQQEEIRNHPERLKGQGEVQVRLEISEPISDESQTFVYGNFNPGFVMQVIEAVVPGTAQEFIHNELLGKLGITSYSWQSGASGLPYGGWRSSMSSRAMAKFGTLVMNKGKWNGEQLIPEAFISQAISPILYTENDDMFGGGKDVSNEGYGYFWWTADLKVGDRTYNSSSAQGGGGQFIILVDELDLMIVTTAHDREPVSLQMAAERILPAFIE